MISGQIPVKTPILLKRNQVSLVKLKRNEPQDVSKSKDRMGQGLMSGKEDVYEVNQIIRGKANISSSNFNKNLSSHNKNSNSISFLPQINSDVISSIQSHGQTTQLSELAKEH